MDPRELFRVALGLQEPWQVADLRFDLEGQQLDLWLEFPRGARFCCPECGQGDCPVHDTGERRWRHLNFFQHRTELHAKVPRVKCPECGVKTVQVPWARPGSGFTLLMEAFILMLVQGGMTPAQAGRLLREYDKRIWRVLEHHVETAREQSSVEEVSTIGVDETPRTRGQQCVSLFMDLARVRRRVVFACEGREGETIQRFVQDLREHGGAPESIAQVYLDRSPASILGLGNHRPDMQMTFAQFHLVKMANEAVAQVRRAEPELRPELKRTRWFRLKNEWNQTERQAQARSELKGSHLQTGRAWRYKSQLQDISLPENAPDAPHLLRCRCLAAQRSRLAPVVKLAATVREHGDGILNWFDSGINNGILEAINGLIQGAKRRARGYRDSNDLITMIYFLVGKLDFRLPALAYAATHTRGRRRHESHKAGVSDSSQLAGSGHHGMVG